MPTLKAVSFSIKIAKVGGGFIYLQIFKNQTFYRLEIKHRFTLSMCNKNTRVKNPKVLQFRQAKPNTVKLAPRETFPSRVKCASCNSYLASQAS